jgi:hypothetical protein
MKQLNSTGRIFVIFDISRFFGNLLRKFNFALKSDKNNGYFTLTPVYVYDVSRNHFVVEKLLLFFIRRLTFSFESFGLLSDVFPFYTILDASCPIFDVQ